MSSLDSLHSFLVDNQADLALLSNPSALFHLTGFQASYGLLFISAERSIFFLDGRYLELAKSTTLVNGVELLPLETSEIVALIRKISPRKILIDEQSVLIKKILAGLEYPSEMVDFSPLRRVKSSSEIEKISQACALTDRTLEIFSSKISYGMTERDLHELWRRSMLDAGGLDYAFDPIIGLNSGSSYPHYMLMNSQKLTPQSMILVDSGVAYEGYKSDVTRVFLFPETPENIRATYEQVLGIQQRVMDSVQVGGKMSDATKLCDELLAARGFAGKMTHSLGHGIGLDVHEEPYFRKDSEAVWQENMTVAIEPGVYFPGDFGIRIEDTVLVTVTGARSLSQFPKKLTACTIIPSLGSKRVF